MKKYNTFKILFGFIILFLLVLFCPQKVQAEDLEINEFSAGDILITEVYYDPIGPEPAEEWIEIFNPTDFIQDLSNWQLTDFSKVFIFPLNTQILPNSFLIIANNSQEFEKLYGFNPDLNNLTISLNNPGDQIILMNPISEVIDVVVYKNGKFCPEFDFCIRPHPGVVAGHSIERVPATKDSDDCSVDFIDQRHPSPGLSPFFLKSVSEITKNSLILNWSEYGFDFKFYAIYLFNEDGQEQNIGKIEEPNESSFLVENLETSTTYQFFIRVYNDEDFSADSNVISAKTDFDHSICVIINEILPSPSTNSDDEFIEIYNSGTSIVNLSGWYLDDIDGGSKPYQIPKTNPPIIIEPGKYLFFYKSQTGIILNDSGGDLARLLWPDSTTIFQTPNYGNAKKGLSWARAPDGTWQWTTTLTPGALNQITSPLREEDEIFLISIAQAKNHQKGAQVLIEGIVTALPDLFSERYFYIQDGSSGIQIYCYKGDFPDLELGDKVRVFGEISISGGEKRVKIVSGDDITILGHSPPIQPTKIKTGKVGNFEGQLVIIKGKIIETSGSTFYIDDGSGQIKISILTKTGIKKPKMKKGDWVEIIGIVSLTKTGYRVLPRFQNDIRMKIISTKSETQSQSVLQNVLGAEKALASPQNLEIGKDYRIKSKVSSNLGWILIFGGIGLLILFLGLGFFNKKRV